MHVVAGSPDPTTITTKGLNATWGNLAFNLESDIGETKNLAAEKPDVVKKLEQALQQWQRQMKPPAWPSKPNRRKVMVDGVPYELNI